MFKSTFKQPVLAAIATVALLGAGYAEASADEDLRLVVRDLMETVQRMEARMEAMEAQSDAPMAAQEMDEAEMGEMEEEAIELTTPTPASRQNAYLPSRGWREGMHYGIEDIDVELHAYIDLEFVDSGPDGSRSGDSTFDSHHANVFLDAALRPNLIGHMEIEFEHGGDEVEIDAAWMEWAVTDGFSFTGGRFYTPFGIERFVWYSPTNALVSRPEPMRQIVPGNFYANGLMASGSLEVGQQSHFTYEFALTDGLGASAATSRRGSRQTRNNNSDRALSGRLSIAPRPNYEFGVSYHTQNYDDAGSLGLDFLGLDFSARGRGFELRAEYVDASLERTAVDGLGSLVRIADLEQDGFYAQLGYTFHRITDLFPAITLVGRYDTVDLDAGVTGGDDRDFFSLGINAVIYDHFRAKLEYRMADEEGPEKDNDTLLGQLVIDF